MKIIQQIDDLLKEENYPYSYNTIIAIVSKVLCKYECVPVKVKDVDKGEFVFELCNHWNIQLKYLKSKNKKTLLLYRRYIVIYYLRYHFRMKVKEIGDYFNRDHSTITSALQSIKCLIETEDPTFNNLLKDANSIIFINN